MDTITGYISGLYSTFQVVIGLSVVILLHELGHFLLAKWNGVKVERFSLGFPPNLLKFRKGETEYVLGLVPLGGYVSLFGEGPEEDGSKSNDPRAFPNKSVAARMSIMSAGVIMNLFLGLGCFIYAYGHGIVEPSARIGTVAPGSPAYLADIRPGDEIVSIDGRRDVSFFVILNKVKLSAANHRFHLELKRPGQEALIPLDVETRMEGNSDSPALGISQFESLILNDIPFLLPAGMSPAPTLPDAGFKPGDVVIAAGPAGSEPVSVSDSQALRQLMYRHGKEPFSLVVKRKADGETKTEAPSQAAQLTVTLAPNYFVDFGFRLAIEPVSAIRKGSIADNVGFRTGDLIVKVNGDPNFDPMQLPSICYQNAGKPMTFEVERGEAGGEAKRVELTATPDDTLPWGVLAFPGRPLDVPGLGLAYPIRAKILEIKPGSPAEKAGLKVGDVINAMTIPGDKEEKKLGLPEEFKFNDKNPDWPLAFQRLQHHSKRAVSLTVNNSNKQFSINPEPNTSYPTPSRGEIFENLTFELPAMGPMNAIRHGFDETVDNIQNIYATLRGLFTGRVPMTKLAGPITIVRVAYSAAGSGLADLVRFLGMLSINLAVLNFLPIPPLDGGQMVYLLAEGVRGRPIPDNAKFASFWVGVVLVLSLMAFVLVQDVLRW